MVQALTPHIQNFSVQIELHLPLNLNFDLMDNMDELFYFQLVILQDEVVCNDLPIYFTVVVVSEVHSIDLGHVVKVGTLDSLHVRYHDTALLIELRRVVKICLIFLIASIVIFLLRLIQLLCHLLKIEVVLDGMIWRLSTGFGVHL